MANICLREAWIAAAKDLGIEVRVPYTVSLENGVRVEADVLVRHFGARHGMLLSSLDDDVFEGSDDAIVRNGYSWSLLCTSYRTYDRDYFIEALRDWGWSGVTENRPSWLRPKT
jgi:hypothetical protein